MYRRRIEPSHDLPHVCQRFLDDLRRWAYEAIGHYADEPATDVHDQGTYTTGWEPLLHAGPDERILRFLQQKRDRIREHFTGTQQWRHGYWRMQEAHHGTEHYELFLGALQRVLPEDRETARQLDDAAEHMGNWSTGAPDWFDWDRRRFHSLFFGADGLRTEPGMALNSPDHLRCVNICLLAASNPDTEAARDRYIALATAYAGEWADAILAGDALPIALTPDGILYEFSAEDKALYYAFMGEAPDLQAEVDRAENLLGSDAVNTFLRLWQESGKAVLEAVAQLDPFDITETALDTGYKRPARRASGVGKRSDAPRWLEDGRERRHNPITLAVAAEIDEDSALHARAVDLARTYFLLARAAFPDGRDHGCSARSVSAIARGHGRENHAGMTTAVLGPALSRVRLSPA